MLRTAAILISLGTALHAQGNNQPSPQYRINCLIQYFQDFSEDPQLDAIRAYRSLDSSIEVMGHVAAFDLFKESLPEPTTGYERLGWSGVLYCLALDIFLAEDYDEPG